MRVIVKYKNTEDYIIENVRDVEYNGKELHVLFKVSNRPCIVTHTNMVGFTVQNK
jgi:hypothetical protein